jgi:hypothetical protein
MLKLELAGNLSGALADLRRHAFDALHEAAVRGMKQEGASITRALQAHVGARMKVKRGVFAKSFKAKLYARDTNRLPMLLIGSKVPWASMHETGGTTSGRMLIPLGTRVGPKRFKAIVSDLMRSGNAFFMKAKSGRIFLMAENIAENSRALSSFKGAQRKKTGSPIRRGAEVPIAELVSRVTVRKRLDVIPLIKSRLPDIVDAVRRELERLSK